MLSQSPRACPLDAAVADDDHMGVAIGEVLGLAVGVAISPVPVIAVILMLFSRSATANSVSFLVGWTMGLFGVGLIVLALGLTASDGEPSTASGVIKILIGALFLALGVRQWRGRPKAGEQAKSPDWMCEMSISTAVT